MSEASKQFLEMVRQAAALLNAVQPQAQGINRFCEQCGGDRMHTTREHGVWEIQTCTGCGHQRWYAVR